MRPRALTLFAALLALADARDVFPQQAAGFARLPAAVLDVAPPSARVRGEPGTMTVQPRVCPTLPITEVRRRIVDIAAQEWGFFGFRVAAPTDFDDNDPGRSDPPGDAPSPEGRRGRRGRLPPAEASRVAASIAGYWAVTPEGSWIVARQNEAWSGPYGIASRWNAPWSAAFISWVMCEAGLGAPAQFRRAIAHHAYIDQAIRARDGREPQGAFVAHDPGEAAIEPGDLLCSSRQPAYRSLAERRRQMGVGARSHCDIVVSVDQQHVRAIGGNVRGVVSLKAFPASRAPGAQLRVDNFDDERPMFAHLKLRATPIIATALNSTPTVKASNWRNQ